MIVEVLKKTIYCFLIDEYNFYYLVDKASFFGTELADLGYGD